MRDYQKASSSDDFEKLSKETAGYRDGTPHENCGRCTMFRGPASCTLVEGKISEYDTCDYFKQKK